MSDTIDSRWMSVDPLQSVSARSEPCWCEADPVAACASAQDGDAFGPAAQPWGTTTGPLPWIVLAFAAPPFFRGAMEQFTTAMKRFEGRALDLLARGLDRIPEKLPPDDGEMLDPLMRMRVEQAWGTLPRQQRVDIYRDEFPGRRIDRRDPLTLPPPRWSTAAARARLAADELQRGADDGLAEARRFEGAAEGFGRLALFQEAADLMLDAAQIYEGVNPVGTAAAKAFINASSYATAAGNAGQAADAMIEAERIWIAYDIEQELRNDPELGFMSIETGETKMRLALLIARDVVERPELLKRLVEYRIAGGEGFRMPALRDGWRHLVAELLEANASAPRKGAEQLPLSGRSGSAADRLEIERIIRFAKHDEELRQLLGGISDEEFRHTCTDLYHSWKKFSPAERHAQVLDTILKKGGVRSVGRVAVEWLRLEVRLRLEGRAAEGLDTEAQARGREAEPKKDRRRGEAAEEKGEPAIKGRNGR